MPQVRLKECGSELIEVADNGPGIQPSDYQSVTLKHHTSKLSRFTDLEVDSCSTCGLQNIHIQAIGSMHQVCAGGPGITRSVWSLPIGVLHCHDIRLVPR